MEKKLLNEYDDTKRMLNTLRNFKSSNTKTIRNINEQEEDNGIRSEPDDNTALDTDSKQYDKKYNVVNNVEVVINSEDELDHELKEDEKGKISQIIDDFRAEISELVKFNKLVIYTDSAKLDGVLTNYNISFIFSVGDDNGVYINNVSLLKLNDEILDVLNKLNEFSNKFVETIDDVILNRRMN